MNLPRADVSRFPIGATYKAVNVASLSWRVERFLADGVHVVLVSDEEPSRRKTVSASVLTEPRYFLPAGEGARRSLADGAGCELTRVNDRVPGAR
jgi:hypothetical protein